MPKVVDSLPAISRPSLVEREGHINGHAPTSVNGNGNSSGAQSQILKSASSRQSLKNRAFGLFTSVDTPKDSASSIPHRRHCPPSPLPIATSGGARPLCIMIPLDTDRTITKKFMAEKQEQARLVASREPIPGTSPQRAAPVTPQPPTPNRSTHDCHEVDST